MPPTNWIEEALDKKLEGTFPSFVTYNVTTRNFVSPKGPLYTEWARQRSISALERVVARPEAQRILAYIAATALRSQTSLGADIRITLMKTGAYVIAARLELNRRNEEIDTDD